MKYVPQLAFKTLLYAFVLKTEHDFWGTSRKMSDSSNDSSLDPNESSGMELAVPEPVFLSRPVFANQIRGSIGRIVLESEQGNKRNREKFRAVVFVNQHGIPTASLRVLTSRSSWVGTNRARQQKTACNHFITKICIWCPGWDLNPHSRCRKRDFKSLASADFATRAQ